MQAFIITIMLQVAAAGPPPKAAPAFACADQLVAKNHSQPVETVVLAHRIADECYREPAADAEGKGGASPELWQSLRSDFQNIVQNRIVAARAKSLKLVR